LEELVIEDVGVFMAIWSILRPFGLFYGHLIYFVAIWNIYVHMVIWYIFPRFGMLHQEKSGDPDVHSVGAKFLPSPLLKNCPPLAWSGVLYILISNSNMPKVKLSI
jgi:hypothetical protein